MKMKDFGPEGGLTPWIRQWYAGLKNYRPFCVWISDVTGTYEAELACYSTSPASDLASSIDDMMTHKFLARMLKMKVNRRSINIIKSQIDKVA